MGAADGKLHCARSNHCRRSRQSSRSRLRRDLAAREFHTIVGIKHFDLGAQSARKQLVGGDIQSRRHNKKFQVGDAPVLGFHPGHRFAADVPARHLQPDGKLILRPALSLPKFTNLRPDHILFGGAFSDAVHRIKTIRRLRELHCTFSACAFA